MKILDITDGAYEVYKTNIRGNKNVSKENARVKLTRNWILGTEVYRYNDYDSIRKYGAMEIRLKGNKIIWMKNRVGGERHWINESEKDILNDIYKLN